MLNPKSKLTPPPFSLDVLKVVANPASKWVPLTFSPKVLKPLAKSFLKSMNSEWRPVLNSWSLLAKAPGIWPKGSCGGCGTGWTEVAEATTWLLLFTLLLLFSTLWNGQNDPQQGQDPAVQKSTKAFSLPQDQGVRMVRGSQQAGRI